MATSIISRLLALVVAAIYYLLRPVWLKLWPPLQILYIFCKRSLLRRKNLVQPLTLPDQSAVREPNTPPQVRTFEGSGNNRQQTTMGMTGCPFSRNTPPVAGTPSEVAAQGPEPTEVSQKLLKRPGGTTKTRPLVNLLGGAWIQFMIHDWFELQKNKQAKPVEFPAQPDGSHMILQPATVSPDDTGINNHDHWWSGCQIYGTTPESNRQLRTGVDGHLKLNADGTYLALDANGVELVGFTLNLWSGIQLLHYIFAKEHNCVCDMLKAHHPDWTDDQLHSTARKIISALIARIHTVEWTTAIVQHPAGRAAQYFLWYGIIGTLLGRKLLRLTKMFKSLGEIGALLFGLSGGPTVLANEQPFSHSEEFITVYRMHALLPDKIDVKDVNTGSSTGTTVGLQDILFQQGTQANTTLPLGNLFTTLGFGHAGALELRNYPTALLSLQTPFLRQKSEEDGRDYRLDMGAVDVWRSREARVSLFNGYRKAFSMRPYRSFDKLAPGDDAARAALQQVYGNPDNMDVMVGLLSENPLPGFIFGESIYTVFLLQTQRRTESDRFLTEDFSEDIYTREGMRWVEETTMSTILRRHVPALANWLAPDDNAFIPWSNTTKRRLHEKVIWDLLFPWEVYGWLRKMGYKW